jgi:hypothetical protein
MKTVNRHDPCIHGDPGMCDDCYNGSKLKRRITAMTPKTPTPDVLSKRIYFTSYDYALHIKELKAKVKELQATCSIAYNCLNAEPEDAGLVINHVNEKLLEAIR